MLRPLMLLLALSALPLAQNISRAQGDETKIIALENLWNQMQINHDAEARKPWDNAGQRFCANMELHRHGDTVAVTGATREKGTEKGKPYAHQGRFTETWIKKDRQWLCVASQPSLIGK